MDSDAKVTNLETKLGLTETVITSNPIISEKLLLHQHTDI